MLGGNTMESKGELMILLNDFLVDLMENKEDADGLFVNFVDGTDWEDNRDIGFWLEGDLRYAGDPGDWLGSTVEDAQEMLRFMYGSSR